MHEVYVTVLMPVYNSEKYISAAIHSVLSQTFSAFELLIVNDGSTDRTREIIGSFQDPRIRVIDKANGGVASALNAGLAQARGQFIARFDADDVCLPQRLEEQVGFLDKHPGYVVVGSDADYMQENGEFLFSFQCLGHTHEEIRESFYFYCPFIHSSVMYRRDVVLEAGGYSEHAHNFEDYLLWTRLLKAGRLANLPLPLIRVRFNPASVTIDEKWRGVEFRKLKRSVIRRGSITQDEGRQLQQIISHQEVKRYKEGSYHALCGKKFLTDNYQPAKARKAVMKAVRVYPFRLDNYALLAASFLPRRWIRWLHRLSPNKL